MLIGGGACRIPDEYISDYHSETGRKNSAKCSSAGASCAVQRARIYRRREIPQELSSDEDSLSLELVYISEAVHNQFLNHECEDYYSLDHPIYK
jgi:hypothetical protein